MTWKAPKTAALVMVDPQLDFCPRGNLPVPEGDKIMPTLNALREHFDTVCLTQDWHPAGHLSFASSHGAAPFSEITMAYGRQTLWPDHCIQGTQGAKFHPGLIVRETDLILQKGTNRNIDSYSAFFENDKKTRPLFPNGQSFTDAMRARGIDTLVFGGLVREICVAWNALDAASEGFKSVIVLDATKRLDAQREEAMLTTLKANKVALLVSSQLPSFFAK